MRAEMLERSGVVVYQFGETIEKIAIDTEDDDVERLTKQAFRQAQNQVRALREAASEKTDGHILHQDIVYRVDAVNDQVYKITGEHARSIKKHLKKYA